MDKIKKILLIFLLFLNCTKNEIIEKECIRASKECQVNRQGIKECNSIYECYYY